MRSSFLAFHALYGRMMGYVALLAGAILFALMFLVCANAFTRKLFNAPITGAMELTEALMPVVILLPMAFTQYRDGHIRATLLVDRVPPVPRRWMRTLMLVVAAAFFYWVTYATWGYALRSWNVGETAWGSIRFPIWPSKFMVTFGAALLAVQFTLDAARLAFFGIDGAGRAHA